MSTAAAEITELHTDTGGIASELAQFASELHYDGIPGEVRVRARHLILDAVGIALASHGFDFARPTLAGIEALAGPGFGSGAGDPAANGGGATVIGHPRRLPLRDAAMANGLLVHGLDYDDTHVPGIIHATASAFPCTFALGERLGASGADVVAAYVVAVEAGARIGSVPRAGSIARVSTLPGSSARSAAPSGRAASSDSTREGSSWRRGSRSAPRRGAWSFWRMAPGPSASTRAGRRWPASPRPTSRARGSSRRAFPTRGASGSTGPTSARGRTASATTRSRPPGSARTGSSGGSRFKSFPACHFLHGCADAAIAIARDHDLRPDEVEEVTALVPEETIATICEPAANKVRPVSDYDAKFSVQYAVAASLSRRAFGLAELDEDARADARILDLAKRVRYRADPASAFPRAFSGEVVVRTRDGRELRHREEVNRGADERPLTNGEIAEKYLENARLTVDGPKAIAIRRAVLDLDRFDDVRAVACELAG